MSAEAVRAELEGAIADAFRLATGSRERDPHHFGLSSVGRCRRQGAYRLAETPVSDAPEPGQGRAANLGTWEHEGLLPLLAKALGSARVEMPVVLRAAGLEVPGHADLVYGATVMDLKTVGEYRLGRADAGPFPDHRLQVGGYALALRQAGWEVRHVAWAYLDRASGNERIHVRPFTAALGVAVVDRVAELRRAAAAPDAAPRDERGPGLSWVCDGCPWLRRCWGEDAAPGRVGAQGVLGREDGAVAAALALYADARDRESAAKQDKEFARAVFANGSAPGTYGAWRWYTGKDGTEPDGAAAVAALEAAGIEVPYRVRSGALQVRPAKRT